MRRRFIVLDLETTGLDIEKDRITELGYVLFEEGNPTPLHMASCFIKQEAPLNQEIVALTGLTDEVLQEFGREPHVVFEEFLDFVHRAGAEFFAGHNAVSFDRPFLANELNRSHLTLPQLPWLDTKIDLPLTYKPKSTSLSYMAADHGFLNPFPHRAVFDSLTCGKLISLYKIDSLIDVIKSPMVEIRAVVSYDDRQKASKLGYFWDAQRKYWMKRIRQCNLQKEQKAAENQFQVIELGRL